MTSFDYKNLKSEEVMDKLGILDINKLNIYNTVNLMFRVKNNTIHLQGYKVCNIVTWASSLE